jgi:hypothetical protein
MRDPEDFHHLVLREIQEIADVAKAHENELEDFVRTLRADAVETNTKKERRELEKMKRRVKERDAIIKKLLEQNAMGAISDERFATFPASMTESKNHFRYKRTR